MADFTPKKLSKEKGKAVGSLPVDNAEHQAPPHLYLEHHHLAKLGVDKMPPVGSKIRISGLAHVGSTSEDHDHAGKGKGPHRRMTLHLHKMEIGKDGISEHEHDESQKAGMKSAIDKALKHGAGSEAADGAEND